MSNFEKIEMTCKLWKGLEIEKQWYQNYPEVLNIITGAITRLRLEIIMVCQEYLKEPELGSELEPLSREEYLNLK